MLISISCENEKKVNKLLTEEGDSSNIKSVECIYSNIVIKGVYQYGAKSHIQSNMVKNKKCLGCRV